MLFRSNGTDTVGNVRALTATTLTVTNVHGNSNVTLTYAGGLFHATTVKKYSDVAILNGTRPNGATVGLIVDFGGKTAADLQKVAINTRTGASPRLHGFTYFNYDVRSLVPSTSTSTVDTYLAYSSTATRLIDGATAGATIKGVKLSNATGLQGLVNLNGTAGAETFNMELYNLTGTTKSAYPVGVAFKFLKTGGITPAGFTFPIVADFFSFGYTNDGVIKSDRINNAIYRVEVEETGDNTSTFAGTLEYVMLNQLNILDSTKIGRAHV